jgi:GNAT superfamily N-acetyltransferase
MAWRLSPPEFKAGEESGNRDALKRLVERGPAPGVIAMRGEEPIGWCAVAPRTSYRYLAVSRVLRPVDDEPVWSITCLFVDRRFRRQGVSVQLLRAAAEFARAQGARVVEGYPVEVKRGHRTADVFVWTGLATSFRAAGFSEVARRSQTRPIMRLNLADLALSPAGSHNLGM